MACASGLKRVVQSPRDGDCDDNVAMVARGPFTIDQSPGDGSESATSSDLTIEISSRLEKGLRR